MNTYNQHLFNQIRDLKKANQTENVKELLQKKEIEARRIITRMRRFASLRPGRVAEYCTMLVCQMEVYLQ